MEIHKDKIAKMQFFKELWERTLKEFDGDVELARIAYKRIMFEEGKSY